MPFGFHPLELVAIVVIALLVFGPKKLPELGSAIGKSINSFKKGMNELQEDEEKKTINSTSSASVQASSDTPNA